MTEYLLKCQTCGNTGVSLQRCGNCFAVLYCSKACQKIDWPTHKKECKGQKSTKEGTAKAPMSGQKGRCSFQNTPGSSGRRQPDISRGAAVINEITEIDDAGNKISEDNKPSVTQNKIGPCNECKKPSCSKVCSRCTAVFYCSQACQKKDWPSHKRVCQRKYTAEERRVIEGRQTDSAFIPQRMVPWLPRSVFVLSPEQALMNESRPPGSLEKASRLAKVFYPLHQIVTTFQEVPPEPFFPWDTFLMQNRRCVLVAFINKYQEHVMRHGVYIKDGVDDRSMVQFYLDDDNPYPFFTYAKVKPGNYICIESPLMHAFLDGTVGIKIVDPRKVKILEKNMLS